MQDYYGRTPLHMAAYRGLSDIMFLLLENRGDVNARDFEVYTCNFLHETFKIVTVINQSTVYSPPSYKYMRVMW